MNLRPWQLWSADGVPAEGTLEIIEVLEGVLAPRPESSGRKSLLHPRGRGSKNPERALPSAHAAGLASCRARATWFTCRRISFCAWATHESSATVNETASEVDRKYIERSGAKGIYPLMYYSHNLHFVSYVRMMQGNFEEAMDYAQRLRKNVDGGDRRHADDCLLRHVSSGWS